eukprot:g9123.t1
MGVHITFGVGLIGLAWWIFSCAFKRIPKPKLIPRGKGLTVREPDELSVLSFNVLSDNLVRSNPSYNYADELYRSWEYRWDRLKDEISIMDADIVCLQEIEIEKWMEWKEFMESLGYKGILLTREHGKKSGRHHCISNATFFRKWRFTPIWELHQNRVLAIGLKWISASDHEHCVFIINVHLEGHPYKPIERMRQVRSILGVLKREHGTEMDVIFCGDFNSTRTNAPWKFLSTGCLEAGYCEEAYPDIRVVKETTEHPFELDDVYEKANAIPEFTTRAPKRRTEVDFIFCSCHLKVGAVLRSMDPRLVPSVDRTLLPNRLTPSDHLPLGVVLLQPKKSDARFLQQATEEEEQNETESVRRSVSSENAINIDMSGALERSVVEGMNAIDRTQKRFSESIVLSPNERK